MGDAAGLLLVAVCGTQAVATIIAVYGLGLVTPLGGANAGVVWDDAAPWFLAIDPIKLLAYRVLDPVKKTAGDSGAGHKPEVMPTRVSQAAA